MPLRACVSLSFFVFHGLRAKHYDPALKNNYQRASVVDTRAAADSGRRVLAAPESSQGRPKASEKVPRHPTCATLPANEPAGRRTAQPSIALGKSTSAPIQRYVRAETKKNEHQPARARGPRFNTGPRERPEPDGIVEGGSIIRRAVSGALHSSTIC